MNIQFTSNPYEGNNVTVSTRGVIDAKIAKTNNVTKRPLIVNKWRSGRPAVLSNHESMETVEKGSLDGTILDRIGILPINRKEYKGKNINPVGAKKLRVNKIVISKTQAVYSIFKEEEIPVEEKVEKEELIAQINALTTPEVEPEAVEEVRGKHEKTVKIPVSDIKKALEEDGQVMTSRTEKNAVEYEAKEEPKQEAKAGDIDLYTNLYNNIKEAESTSQTSNIYDGWADNNSFYGTTNSDDISRQIQGAKKELSMAEAEGKKLLDEYDRALKECQTVAADIKRKEEEQKKAQILELSRLKESLQSTSQRNLEVTQNLADIRRQLAVMNARREALEADSYGTKAA